MSIRRAAFLISLALSTAGLALGYYVSGNWLAAVVALVPGVAMAFYRKPAAPWLQPAYLVVTVCAAATGLFIGAPAALMIFGAAAAIGAWDLANVDPSLKPGASTKHVLLLAPALGLGVLLAMAGIMFPVRIPFIVLFPLVILDLFSLYRVSLYLEKRNGRSEGS